MTKKEIKAKAKETMEYLDTVSRYYQGRVFCVNVKRHGDDFDVEDISSKYPKQVRKAVAEEFADEKLGDIHWRWLEYEASFFVDDYLKQNCEDREDVEKYMTHLKDDSIGFYGRSGGWFGVSGKVYEEFEELLLDLDDNDYTFGQINQYHDIGGMFAKVEAITWVLNEADKYNKGLTFKDELTYKIEEFVSEITDQLKEEKEVKTAKTLAEKHGYVLAKTV